MLSAPIRFHRLRIHSVAAQGATRRCSIAARLVFDNLAARELPADTEVTNVPRPVSNALYTFVDPTPVPEPRLRLLSREVSELVGIGVVQPHEEEEFAQIFAGNCISKGSRPLSHAYGGHQFGSWAGQLGDGRAISLGEVIGADGRHWELQLKGAGRTPYSRFADGRAVLRSSIREFLASEFMAAARIPTTRALSLVTTGEPVTRDILYNGNPRPEPGAIVCRVAHSFMRIGSFQLLQARGEEDNVRVLADHVARRLLGAREADGLQPSERYRRLYSEVCARNAELVAQWLGVGFVHAVLNTDNVSLLGLTIDYGPYGFVERFDPTFTPNLVDQASRYSYRAQPSVMAWNLARLGSALSPILPKEEAQAILERFPAQFQEARLAVQQRKLGLASSPMEEGDDDLYMDLLALMGKSGADFTSTFRALSRTPYDPVAALAPVRGLGDMGGVGDEAVDDEGEASPPGQVPPLAGELEAVLSGSAAVGPDLLTEWKAWQTRYMARVRREIEQGGANDDTFIPRNHLLFDVNSAAEMGDYAPLEELFAVLRSPFEEHVRLRRPEHHWARVLPLTSAALCSAPRQPGLYGACANRAGSPSGCKPPYVQLVVRGLGPHSPTPHSMLATVGKGAHGRASSAMSSLTRRAKSTRTRKSLKPLLVTKRGLDLVHDPLYNKGTGYDMPERDRLGLRGLVPPRMLNMDVQKEKLLQHIRHEPDPLQRNMHLASLQNRNETLFYRILVDNIKEFAPIVYTPTVGQVCQKFGVQFRRTRGMYFSSQDRGQMHSMVYNWPIDDVQVIVVTDGSRILGLGDLGANGMGIPIGKLSLYCAAGGIYPHRVLPIQLDLGTDNPELLKAPHYLGLQHPRLKGEEYFSLVDEFMDAVRHRWPNVLVQFEDFSSDKASDILQKYRMDHLCFNDDIQGTGAVTLAGVFSALKATGQDTTDLKNQRIVVAGAGSAGLGVATTLLQGMVHQGMPTEEAQRRFWVLDQHGLLSYKRRSDFTAGQRFFSRRDEDSTLSLLETVRKVKPTILLGLTACRGVFTEEVVREMAKHVESPIVFPLSNPTANAECTAEEAYHWTDGRAVFASGSPFDPVEFRGETKYPSQCNNVFIFPGVGAGAVLCQAKRVTDRMFYASAEALATTLTDEERALGMVFPDISRIRDVTASVATGVIKSAIADGLALNKRVAQAPDVRSAVRDAMYEPEYFPIVEASENDMHLANWERLAPADMR